MDNVAQTQEYFWRFFSYIALFGHFFLTLLAFCLYIMVSNFVILLVLFVSVYVCLCVCMCECACVCVCFFCVFSFL